jgi:hypothetical protein
MLEQSKLPMLAALRQRILYTRAFESSGADLPREAIEWISDDPTRARATEDRIARELGLEPGELLLDYPAKTQMLGLDIPVLQKNGGVRRLTAEGWSGSMNLPKLSEELYQSARWLRVFTKGRMKIDRAPLLEALGA